MVRALILKAEMGVNRRYSNEYNLLHWVENKSACFLKYLLTYILVKRDGGVQYISHTT